MTLPDFWAALSAAAVTLSLGGKTGLMADPASSLTDDLRAFIALHRGDIIATLRNESAQEAALDFFAQAPAAPGHPALCEFIRLKQGWVPTLATRMAFSGGDSCVSRE